MGSQRAVFQRRQLQSPSRCQQARKNDTAESVPEVPEERVPMGESLDGLARITSKELAPTPFCEKWHPPECLFYKTKSGCRFGEKCSNAHRQFDEQPSKRSKKNGDKSAVATLKKYESYDRTVKPVVCRDTSHERHGPIVCNSSNTRQLGCVFQDMEPPKLPSISRKSSDMRKPIRRVKFTKAFARHAYIRDQNPSLGLICPGEPPQRGPNAPKFEDRSQEETVARARCPRSSVEADQKCSKIKGEKQSNILLTFGK